MARQSKIDRTLVSRSPADLLPKERRATGFGMLGTVDSIGDLASSLIVGLLWSHVSHEAGFAYAGVV